MSVSRNVTTPVGRSSSSGVRPARHGPAVCHRPIEHGPGPGNIPHLGEEEVVAFFGAPAFGHPGVIVLRLRLAAAPRHSGLRPSRQKATAASATASAGSPRS